MVLLFYLLLFELLAGLLSWAKKKRKENDHACEKDELL
jgi:hypothetical protein